MIAAAATATDFGLPITPEQRKALFAIGKARGWSIDDLRDLTPAGSISALTRLQAARLLESLNAGTAYAGTPRRSRTPRRAKGVFAIATPAQRNKIEALRIDLGWTPDGVAGFLHDRRHTDGRRMTRIDSTTDAAAVIELLKAVLVKSRQARDRRDSEADGAARATEHRQGQAQDRHESEPDIGAMVSEHGQDEASRQERREGSSAALGATEGAFRQVVNAKFCRCSLLCRRLIMPGSRKPDNTAHCAGAAARTRCSAAARRSRLRTRTI